MARLRQAFSEAHALQCGYCTPGMLIAARDLVRRKGRISRAEIRTEMSGNLCRCTGYMGLVDAIERVMADPATPDVIPAQAGIHATSWLGPAPGPSASPPAAPPTGGPGVTVRADPPRPVPARSASIHDHAHPRHRRPARGGRRRNPHLAKLRPSPPARCGVAAHVGRGGGGALDARAHPCRPAAGRQGRRAPGSQDRPDRRRLRRRGHGPAIPGRIPPGRRGPRRRQEERLAGLGQRRLSPVRGCRRGRPRRHPRRRGHQPMR